MVNLSQPLICSACVFPFSVICFAKKDQTMRLQDYDVSTRHRAQVVESRRLTEENSADEIREITLDVEDSLQVEVGQHVGVLAPGQAEFGQPHHLRLYTVADVPQRTVEGGIRIHLCVKRCWYLDPYSGERYQGVASHYLCDLRAGDPLELTGPYGHPFEIPDSPDANLILIGAGTGIAPFRAFIKHLYQHPQAFHGKIWLFHGGRTGLDLLYMNQQEDDFAQYYDQETFQAIAALSSNPDWSDLIDWETAILQHGSEIWKMLQDSRTFVYLAGLEPIRDQLDSVFCQLAGSIERWHRRKAELTAGRRWIELLY
jgi:ferredoxin--NADP+ reductase